MFIQQVDLVLVFGGDGTILKAAKDFIIGNKPILGINMGNVGFLTDVSLDNLSKLLQEIFSGDFVIEERSLVQATIGDFEIFGLNEIVIHSGSYAQLMQYSLELDEKIQEMVDHNGPVIFDCHVDPNENCFPMIPSGKPHNQMILGPNDQKENKIKGNSKSLV